MKLFSLFFHRVFTERVLLFSLDCFFEGFLFSIGCLFEEFVVIADHHATCENELSVKAGDIVRVIKKDEETGTYIQPRVMWRP